MAWLSGWNCEFQLTGRLMRACGVREMRVAVTAVGGLQRRAQWPIGDVCRSPGRVAQQVGWRWDELLLHSAKSAQSSLRWMSGRRSATSETTDERELQQSARRALRLRSDTEQTPGKIKTRYQDGVIKVRTKLTHEGGRMQRVTALVPWRITQMKRNSRQRDRASFLCGIGKGEQREHRHTLAQRCRQRQMNRGQLPHRS